MAKEILKFSAEWCGPCKMLSKALEGEDLGVPLREVDIDQEADFARSHGIRGVPTLILVDDEGIEIKRRVGAGMLKDVKEWLADDSAK